MSTNFEYVRQCEVTGEYSSLHLGKSSGGWRFLLRAHPTLGLTSFQALQDFFAKDPGTVLDEYGRERSPSEFVAFVEGKQINKAQRPQELLQPDFPPSIDERKWVDSQGYSFANYEFC